MTPLEASKKISVENVRKNPYGDHINLSKKQPKFKVSDRVRMSNYTRAVLDKGYTRSQTEEMFVVVYTNPLNDALKDSRGEPIKISFYE